jgi:hypothetical protein
MHFFFLLLTQINTKKKWVNQLQVVMVMLIAEAAVQEVA